MKVLHINTYASGGAYTAALRLHDGLLNAGGDSSMLTLDLSHRNVKNHRVFPQFSRYGLSLAKRIANKLNIRNLKEIDRQKAAAKLNHQVEYFSSPLTDYNIARYIDQKCEADIIHLHWVANFLDYPSFFAHLKKPVVWTLHDQAPFSSYWHYSEDHKADKYSERLHAQYLGIKDAALKGWNLPLEVAAPSNWLKNASQKSEVLGRFPHHLIRYGLNTNIFRRQTENPTSIPGNQLREESIKILFICQALGNRRKGMDLLTEAVNLLEDQSAVQLIAVGEPSEALSNALGDGVLFTGTIDDENELARMYSAVDCMVIPSRQDNLPNTLLESLCCGTPVVGTPAGGIAEILADDELGVLAEDFTSQSLSSALRLFIDRGEQYDSQIIERKAHEAFNERRQAEDYLELYNALAARS